MRYGYSHRSGSVGLHGGSGQLGTPAVTVDAVVVGTEKGTGWTVELMAVMFQVGSWWCLGLAADLDICVCRSVENSAILPPCVMPSTRLEVVLVST